MGNEPRDDPRSPLEAFKDAAVLIFSAFVLIQLFIWVDPREFREIGDDGSCERLEEWINDNGGMIYNAKCKIMPQSGGRGLITTAPIQYKQTYITVPEHLWFHEKTAKQQSDIASILNTDPVIAKECGKTWGANGEPCRLILGLAYETVKKDSFWKAYVDTFPKHPTSPVWWKKKQLDQLGSEVVKKQVINLQKYVADEYKALFPYLTKTYPKYFKKKRWTLKLLTEISLHVWGRAFDTSAQDPAKPRRRTWGMIPFADLVNHGSHIESFYGDDVESSSFSCWASEGFDTGAEIFQSYGSHRSSTHFFLYYGFVATGYYRADYISFNINQAQYTEMSAKVPAAKRKLLPKYNALTGFAGIDGHISNAFIRNLRTFLDLTGHIPAADLRVSRGYKYVLDTIMASTQKAVKGFKTTYKQDFDVLQGPFETYDKWVMLTFRSRYKYIFERVLANVEYRTRHDPAGSESADKHGWMEQQFDGLLVYDESEVSPNNAQKSIKDSMFLVTIPFEVKKAK